MTHCFRVLLSLLNCASASRHGSHTPSFQLNSSPVSEGLVPLTHSTPRVLLLEYRDPVGLPDTLSAGLLLWTVLIGRTDFATTTWIPNPTLHSSMLEELRFGYLGTPHKAPDHHLRRPAVDPDAATGRPALARGQLHALERLRGRGLHSSTFQLNLSRF